MQHSPRIDDPKIKKSIKRQVEHKTFWRVTWILVVLALVGSGAYFAYRFSQYGKEKATNLVAEGQALERDYRLTEALQKYETAQALSWVAKPQAAEAAFRSAAIYISRNQFTDAESFLEKATELDSNNAQFFLSLAQAELVQRKLDEAAQHLLKVGQLTGAAGSAADPELASQIAVVQARLAVAQEDQEAAEKFVRQALQANSKNAEALFIDAALSLHNETTIAQKNLNQIGNLTQDKALLAKAQALMPIVEQILNKISNPAYEFALVASTLLDVKEADLALLEAQQAVKKDDEYRDAWLVQGRAELATDRLDEAQASLEKAAALDPTSGQVAFVQGLLAVERNDAGTAIKALRKAIDLGYTTPAVFLLLAEQYQAQGEQDGADNALLAGLKANPDHRELLLARFWLTYRTANGKEIKKTADDFKEAFPKDPLTLALQGLANFKLGKVQAATKSAEDALQTDQLLAAAHLVLGLVNNDRTELVRAIDLDWEGDVADIAQEALRQLDSNKNTE